MQNPVFREPGPWQADGAVSGAWHPAGDPQAIRASVIIACFNGAATLAETLEGILAQDWDRPWEIVFADNGSTDASAAIFRDVAARHPERPMRLVDAADRRGKSHALNRAIAASRGEALLFCDADDVPGEGWLQRMAEALETRDLVAARQDFRRLNSGWMLEYRWNSQADGLQRLNHAPYTLHAGGGTMGFRRRVFDTIGGFDPGFTVVEDTEFSVRAQLAGFELTYLPDAVMHVRLRPDLHAIYRQSHAYAKYTVLLYKRYRDRGAPRPGRLREFLRTWMGLARWRLAKAVLRRPETMAERARFQWQLGWETGRLAGLLRFHVPPP